jgi:endonuclease/exonuclease/phosphatase (EEP) superfamily protein YafD
MKLVVNAACLACTLLLSSCVSLTEHPRALVYSTDGVIRAQSLSCAEANRAVGLANGSTPALDGRQIRVLTWNIHKQADNGWQRDLRTFARDNDLVLLQEVSFDDSLLAVIEAENLHWVMASSFVFADRDLGVLTASRATPLASCTQRIVEPLLRLPKSAIISWFRLRDSVETLAVVNLHAINFSLSLGAYRRQFDALGEVLAEHRGPIILAGDLNTWTDGRTDAVAAMARELGLEEIRFATDGRTLFMGKQLDHIFVRGLATAASAAIAVESSDHNPVAATLKVAAPARAR